MSTLQQAQSALVTLERKDRNISIARTNLERVAKFYLPSDFKFYETEQSYNFSIKWYNEALATYENTINNLPTAYRKSLTSCSQDFTTLNRIIRQLIAEENGQDAVAAEIEYLIGRVRARRDHMPIRTDKKDARVDLRGSNAGQKIHVTQIYEDDWRISWDAYPDGTIGSPHWSFQGDRDSHPKNLFGMPLGKPKDALFGEAHKK